jgi:hypothetical protein
MLACHDLEENAGEEAHTRLYHLWTGLVGSIEGCQMRIARVFATLSNAGIANTTWQQLSMGLELSPTSLEAIPSSSPT